MADADPDPCRLAALAVLSAAGVPLDGCDLAAAAEQVRREVEAAELRGRALQASGSELQTGGER